MVHDREIVWSKIPDNIYIVLEQPEVNSRRVVVVKLSESAFLQKLLDFSHGAREQESVIDHDLQVLSLGEFNEHFRLAHIAGEGFLYENVFPILESGFSQLIMRPNRR